MHSTLAVDVAAAPELVFALTRDVTRWPRLLPHYVSARVVADEGERRVVVFVARRPLPGPLGRALGLGLPVAWRSRCWPEPAGCRLRFVHLGGATAGMDVTWRIEPRDGGCRVTIEHDFSPRPPGALATLAALAPAYAIAVDRLFTRPIAGRTLATFRSLAEAVARSGLAGATNPPP